MPRRGETSGPEPVVDDGLREGIPLAGDAGVLRAAARRFRQPTGRRPAWSRVRSRA